MRIAFQNKTLTWSCSACGFALLLVITGCGSEANVEIPPAFDRTDVEAKVTAFCSDCHQMPEPGMLPKSRWPHGVRVGYDVYFGSGRQDLQDIPPMHLAVEYFRREAPEKFEFPEYPRTRGPVKFRKYDFRPNENDPEFPAIAHLTHIRRNVLDPEDLSKNDDLIGCDMRSGDLFRAEWNDQGKLDFETFGNVPNASRIRETDLDQDGRPDWIVSDLGNFVRAMDHFKGAVVWVRPEDDGGGYERIIVQTGLSRIGDIQGGDLDGDGDEDLVVAEFGWRNTGRVLIFENEGLISGVPAFAMREVDGRHGAVEISIVDMDHDGQLDFVTVFGQEFESVEWFQNQGDLKFEPKVIFEAKRTSYGSSSIEVVDFDEDGDLDVLLCNGDAFDITFLRPYHSVQWLENKGEFPFEHHHLTSMLGAHRARLADLDGDGDLDIVASALLPMLNLEDARYDVPVDSVIWLEQLAPDRYQRHLIQEGPCLSPCLDVADYNGDGAPDIAVGYYLIDEDAGMKPWVTMWINESVQDSEDGS